MAIQKLKRQALHGPRWIKRRRWADASWFVHIGYLRHIPNWVHMQPGRSEFVDMLWTMAHYNSGPIAVRYPEVQDRRANQIGTKTSRDWAKREVVQHGREVAIFGPGQHV